MASITGQAGTNLGPLTTVWTPPPACTAMIPLCDICNVGYMAQRCDVSIEGAGAVRDNTACWPPVQSKVASPTHPFGGWGFYSPGIQCPTGYSSACTVEYQKRGDWLVQFNLVEGETAVGCCPSGFQCTNLYGNTCIQVAAATDSVTIETASCVGTVATDITEAVFPDIITRTAGGATTTELRRMTMFAPMIQINFQASDLAGPESSTTGALPTTDASTNTGDSLTTAAAATSGAETAVGDEALDVGLMGGAKIGAIVGAVLGGLALIGLVAWALLRKRRGAERRDPDVPSALGVPPSAPYQPVHHGGYNQAWGGAGMYEMEAPQRSLAELSSHPHTPIELGKGQGMPAEMPAFADDFKEAKGGYRS